MIWPGLDVSNGYHLMWFGLIEVEVVLGALDTAIEYKKQPLTHCIRRITSYINNVHPTLHRSLYRTTEKLIDALIPFFNKTLIDLKAPGYQNQRIHLADITRNPVVNRDPGDFHPPELRAYPDFVDEEDCYHDHIFVDLKREFWNIGLQFVLHMRDINLTIDKPNYEGEEWHIQGQNVRHSSNFYPLH